MKFLEAVGNIFRIPDLRKRLLFVLALLVIGFALEKHFLEFDRPWWACHVAVGNKPFGLFGVLGRGVFDGRADHVPPFFKAGWDRFQIGLLLAAPWVAEQNSVECLKNAATVGVGPGDGVGAFEFAVFRVGSIDGEAHK